MNDNNLTTLFCIWVTAVLLLAALVIVVDEQRNTIKREAVERGYAIHNPTTGVWQWK